MWHRRVLLFEVYRIVIDLLFKIRIHQQQEMNYQQQVNEDHLPQKVKKFIEQRNKTFLTQLFTQMYSSTVQNSQFSLLKAYNHHEHVLQCKVFNGLMLSGLDMRKGRQKIMILYIKGITKKWFTGWKQVINTKLIEKTNKIEDVKAKIKISVLNSLRSTYLKKKQIRSQRRKVNQSHQSLKEVDKSLPILGQQAKSQQPLRNIQSKTGVNFYASNLNESRRSVFTSFQFPTKRKFAPIKQIPKLPDLTEVAIIETPKQEIVEVPKKDLPKIQKKETSPKSELPVQPASSIKSFQKDSILKQQNNKNRQAILSLIAALKIVQIAQLSPVLKAIPQDSKILFKSYLSKSEALLQSICK